MNGSPPNALRRRLRNLPIRQKVSLVLLASPVLGVALSLVWVLLIQALGFKQRATVEAQAVAGFIEATTDVFVSNPDLGGDQRAGDILRSLSGIPDIQSAALYLPDGRLYAEFSRAGMPLPARPEPPGTRFHADRMVHVQELRSATDDEGDAVFAVLRLESNLATQRRERQQSFAVLALISGLIVALSIGLAFLLQRAITRPVTALAATAREIARHKDYRLRAEQRSDDEIGQLAAQFNEMLAALQHQTEALRRGEERLRLILEGANMGILDHDVGSGTLAWTPQVEVVMGLPPGSRSGSLEPFLALVHPDDRAELRRVMEAEGMESDQWLIEFRVPRRDGSVRWMEGRGRIYRRADGAAERVAGTVSDITVRKEVEAEVRSLNEHLEQRVQARTAEMAAAYRELESFCYAVSHDLRTPLRAIDGFSQLVVEDCGDRIDPESRQRLHRVRIATQRMGQLIDDLLNLSRLSRRELKVAPVDLSRLARDVADGLVLGQPGRPAEFVIAPDLTLRADPMLLRVVVEQLLGNAWKYSAKQPRTRIEVGSIVRDGRTVFFVQDNGVGFDMQFAGKLFGAFQRLHAPDEFEGTGVGLAMVQRIIHRHGGQVWGEGRPGEGATFYFTLQL